MGSAAELTLIFSPSRDSELVSDVQGSGPDGSVEH